MNLRGREGEPLAQDRGMATTREFLHGRLSRRDFNRGMAALGVSVTAVPAIIAACQAAASTNLAGKKVVIGTMDDTAVTLFQPLLDP